MRPHRRQHTRLLCPWDSPGENTVVGCHFLLQCMKGKSESEVAQLCIHVHTLHMYAAAAKSLQSCLTLRDPMDCSPPGSSIHGIFQARVLEWAALSFSMYACIQMYAHTPTHMYVHTHRFTHMHASHVNTCMHAHMYIPLPTLTNICSQIHVHTPVITAPPP